MEVGEPATRGKAILHTTLGPFEVEFWPKESPKAVKNFIQLALDGYYDGSRFHRVIKDYLAQGGIPIDGMAEETIFGGTFDDEFHSRLKFSRRGEASALNGKHTIFGTICGPTLHNLMRINDLEIDASTSSPTDPPLIHRIEVVESPFPELAPRPGHVRGSRVLAQRKAEKEAAQARAAKEEREASTKRLTAARAGIVVAGAEDDGDGEDVVAVVKKKPRAIGKKRRRVRTPSPVYDDEDGGGGDHGTSAAERGRDPHPTTTQPLPPPVRLEGTEVHGVGGGGKEDVSFVDEIAAAREQYRKKRKKKRSGKDIRAKLSAFRDKLSGGSGSGGMEGRSTETYGGQVMERRIEEGAASRDARSAAWMHQSLDFSKHTDDLYKRE